MLLSVDLLAEIKRDYHQRYGLERFFYRDSESVQRDERADYEQERDFGCGNFHIVRVYAILTAPGFNASRIAEKRPSEFPDEREVRVREEPLRHGVAILQAEFEEYAIRFFPVRFRSAHRVKRVVREASLVEPARIRQEFSEPYRPRSGS